QETREEITELSLSGKQLQGKLVIEDFPNLKKIDCRNNKELTSIELNNLPQLEWFNANNCQLFNIMISNCLVISYLNVANNLLTDTRFLNYLDEPEKLTVLSIHTNNFTKQDLRFLEKFVNLKNLFLDNADQIKFEKG